MRSAIDALATASLTTSQTGSPPAVSFSPACECSGYVIQEGRKGDLALFLPARGRNVRASLTETITENFDPAYPGGSLVFVQGMATTLLVRTVMLGKTL